MLLKNLKTLRKKFWFFFFRSIECVPRSIEKIKKFELDHLTSSIDTRSPLDRSKNKFDRSTINRKSILLKGLITVSLDRSKVIFDQSKLVKPKFPEIFQGSFLRFFMNKHASYEHYRLRLMSKLKSIDAIALRFKLTYLNLNLNNIITPISVFIKS